MVWDWKLTTEGGHIEFGDDASLHVVESWAVDPGKLRTEDYANPRGDGSRFGRDLRPGQTVAFSMWVNGSDENEALSGLARMSALWRNDASRSRGGSLATLTHPRGRFAVGRPRAFTSDTQRVQRGYATAKAEFECADDLWYGQESQTQIFFQVAAGGGLRFPARSPFRFTSVGETRNAAVLVDGDVATWPVFEIHGPVTNPEIEVQGVGRLVFDVNLAYDQFLRVDTRPWARWVQRGVKGRPDELVPLPGALSPGGSRLSDMSLLPGSYTVLLRGFDATGTAEMRVSTWPAYTSF